MAEQVITSKMANALIEEASVDLPSLPHDKILREVLGAFKKAYGGLWVGGRVTLTTTEVRFSPNALNRLVHSGQLDIAIPLAAIIDVDIVGGFVTKIVAIHAADKIVKVRCYGAAQLVDQIRSAVQQAKTI